MDMKRKWMILVVLSVAIVFLAIAAVTASSWKPLNSPLYTVRMEHASSDLNFLPTEVNNFTYSAERDYNFDYNAEEGYCSDAKPLATSTSFGCNTCEPICLPSEDNTCCNTCGLTCVNTLLYVRKHMLEYMCKYVLNMRRYMPRHLCGYMLLACSTLI